MKTIHNHCKHWFFLQTPSAKFTFSLNDSRWNNFHSDIWFQYTSLIVVVGGRSRGRPEGSLSNSYSAEVYGRALLLSLDCSTLPSIRTLYCWVLNKEVSSTIFKVFGMMRPGIEPRFSEPLENTLPTRPMSWYNYLFSSIWSNILLSIT